MEDTTLSLVQILGVICILVSVLASRNGADTRCPFNNDNNRYWQFLFKDHTISSGPFMALLTIF